MGGGWNVVGVGTEDVNGKTVEISGQTMRGYRQIPASRAQYFLIAEISLIEAMDFSGNEGPAQTSSGPTARQIGGWRTARLASSSSSSELFFGELNLPPNEVVQQAHIRL